MIELQQIRTMLTQHQPQLLTQQNFRQAAVAMLLREQAGETEVLLIRRAEHELDPWSGDLAFPGGGVDPADRSPRAAAERETFEEIGLKL
ncbi:MAG TPA: CoA pyrophosphatase, partial [Pelovirga sp.]|nr:CoA pyrophosphatase [Pelovirga sp.]